MKKLKVAHDCEHFWTKKPEDATNEEFATFHSALPRDVKECLSVKHFSGRASLSSEQCCPCPACS